MAGEAVDAVAGVDRGGTDGARPFGVASAGDANQFKNALDTEAVDKGVQAQRGDIYSKILSPLYEFRQKFDEIAGDISAMVARGNISMGDLFSVQFQLMQLGFMNDLTAKTGDKLSQGVQTLFRNQG
jgi:hypothetical protein